MDSQDDKTEKFQEYKKLSQFFLDESDESLHIVMVVVDRCISDECYLIEVSELAEDIFTDSFRADSLLVLCPLILESIDGIFELVGVKWSLHESLQHRTHNLGTIVWLEFTR